MSVSRCMGKALTIAQKPRAQWREAIEALPETCPGSDCTGGMGCRARVADYMRIQWRMIAANFLPMAGIASRVFSCRRASLVRSSPWVSRIGTF